MSTTFTIKRGDTIPSMVATLSSTVNNVDVGEILTVPTTGFCKFIVKQDLRD